MKTTRMKIISYLCHALLIMTMLGCATEKSLGEKLGMADPSFSKRLELVFNPPWWYQGPIKYMYDKMHPPPWYQGSLEWMSDAVKETCDDKTTAMVKAAAAGGSAMASMPSPITVVYGVARIVSTGGVVTYCRLKE